MLKVKKAIIPAAGLGTRFLPITKSIPKEMLPIVDKPALQYIIEEIVNSGIEEILVITGRNKECIENHFDNTPELDDNLLNNKKMELLEISKYISNLANIHYIRQKEAKGLAHAVHIAKAFVGNEPFAILLGDDMIYTDESQKPCIKQLIDCYESTGICTIASMKVPEDEVYKYGNLGIEKQEGRKIFVNDMIEKPNASERLSNEVVIGRYVCPPEIFEIIENTPPSKSGEVYFTDSLLNLAKQGKLCAYEFEGVRYDTGDKIGYLKASTEYALRNEKLKDEFKEYLKDLVKTF